MPTDNEFEAAAKAGYEAMIRQMGYDPAGEHAWERQPVQAQIDWITTARVIVPALQAEIDRLKKRVCQLDAIACSINFERDRLRADLAAVRAAVDRSMLMFPDTVQTRMLLELLAAAGKPLEETP